jgi:hypothetical protein
MCIRDRDYSVKGIIWEFLLDASLIPGGFVGVEASPLCP